MAVMTSKAVMTLVAEFETNTDSIRFYLSLVEYYCLETTSIHFVKCLLPLVQSIERFNSICDGNGADGISGAFCSYYRETIQLYVFCFNCLMKIYQS